MFATSFVFVHHERHCVELVERIQRLERAVFPAGEAGVAHEDAPTGQIDPAKTSNSRLSNQDEEQQRTSQWLEGLLTTNVSAKAATTSFELATILSDFPIYNDAEVLLDYFTKTIDASYRTLHIPTTWQSLREFYNDLSNNCPPSATDIAFFLSVFAGSVYVSKNGFQFETGSLGSYPQQVLAERWTCVTLAHLCTQIEGLSGSFGLLSATGLRMARSMKIHRLDSAPYREQRRQDGANMVELEVKRRIWWHMVASDWLLSYVPGPNEGTYTLHPRQMEIIHPSNVEDNKIPAGTSQISEESYSLPLSSPTSMTYFLCRIQVATLAREVVDCLPPSFFASPGTECCDEVYNKIIAQDKKYQQFLQSLPPFFQLTIQDHMSYQALLGERPYLEWQRYLINFVVHTHLARLHRPFLIRGSMQQRFAYSRKQCITSAETVIEIQNHAMSNHSVGAFTFVLQHSLMAAIILAMDVCFNPDKIQIPVPQRKQYVLQACRALEAELNAKTIPPNDGMANEHTSNSQLMKMSEDKTESAEMTEALAPETAISRGKRRRRAGSAAPRETSPGHLIVNQAIRATPQRNGSEQAPEGAYPPTYHEQVSCELEETPVSGELIVDELWDEFFTVGSTFNDTDWDTFLLDAGEQIGGL
ncbi:Zn(II)2Cys6 transcription factor [Aspergillus terreus]|uniref:Zn(II)2Cys6 transcription factor n=1 Tax=Aspergillus terreus TaxID=33178 RepID=A0A5M3Z697_ASPTE|nr:hypothetical protein ATETN484_0010029600 [Aspergillus terreus]GFF18343.1 Zn(II)2Cys6 transcription factor [Aspergillus terreus]